MPVLPRRHHVVFLGGPGIVYEEQPPPAELAPWVAVRWRMRASERFELRVVPDGCMDLIGDDVVGSLSGRSRRCSSRGNPHALVG